MPTETSGPFVALAVFCERVLTEQDGIVSIIRIVDRLTITANGPEAPREMPALPVNLTAILGFKAGQAHGTYTLQAKMISPSQAEEAQMTMPLLFEGQDRGQNAVIAVAFLAKEEGLYWLEVYLNDVLMTEMPLRLVYQWTG